MEKFMSTGLRANRPANKIKKYISRAAAVLAGAGMFAGAVVFCIPQDGTCEVLLEDVEGWMLVRYNGYIGFVYESFLEEI